MQDCPMIIKKICRNNWLKSKQMTVWSYTGCMSKMLLIKMHSLFMLSKILPILCSADRN